MVLSMNELLRAPTRAEATAAVMQEAIDQAARFEYGPPPLDPPRPMTAERALGIIAPRVAAMVAGERA